MWSVVVKFLFWAPFYRISFAEGVSEGWVLDKGSLYPLSIKEHRMRENRGLGG